MLCIFLSTALAADLTFAVVADTQGDGEPTINWQVFPQIIEDMNTHHPDVGLFPGDLVNGATTVSATRAQWEDFVTVVSGFEGVALPLLGNHDVYGGAGTYAAFRETFDWLPTDDCPEGEEGVSYYYDVGKVRFIGINSDQPVSNPFAVSAQGMVWLDRVLSESGDLDQVFVFTHHPVSFSDEGGMGTTSGDFWQTLVAYDVTGLFVGHWHRYQPSQLGAGGETWETIIGTGGGPQTYSPIREYQQVHGFLLVEVTGRDALATFYGDEDGDGAYDDVLDQFVMRSADPSPIGLVARYTFDADGADSAPDGRGIDAALSGDAHLDAAGASGQALALDGTDDFAVAGALDDYVLDLHGDLTLSLWVRLDDVSPVTWGNALIDYATNDYYTEDEETNYAYWLNYEADGRLRFYWEHDDGVNVSLMSDSVPQLGDGDWHHVAVTRDAKAATFYVDGVQIGAPVTYEAAPTGGGRGMLYLGADTEGAGILEMLGALDEVCIFDVPLDADQVAELAQKADCAALLGGGSDTGDTGILDDTGDTDDTGVSDDTGGARDTGSGRDTQQPQGDPPPRGGELSAGCGCASGGVAGGAWVALLGLAAALRRRDRRASSPPPEG